MLKMTIDNEEVVSDKDITINEEMLSASSTILNNVYPKEWEEDKDYTSRFYYPQDYSKALIQRSYVTQEAEAGTTIQVNGSATLTDVDTTKNSRVLRLLGQTSQTGTPTPTTPIPVNVVSGDNEINVVGKNLLSFANITNNTAVGITRTINQETITLNGTTTGAGSIVAKTSTGIILKAGTYIGSMTTSGSYNIPSGDVAFYLRKNNTTSGMFGKSLSSMPTSGQYSAIFTLTEDTEIFFEIYTNASNISFNNYTCKFQIEKSSSSTATSYEPYQGNTYNIDLRTSKNLFNKDTIINGKVLGSNGALNDASGYIVGDYIQVKPSTQYTISFDYTTKENLRVGYYQKDKTFIERPYSGDRPWTITTPSNCYYIRICTPDNYTNVQCEEGSQQTTYEAYSSIELCKIGNYQDYIYKDSDKWYLYKAIGKIASYNGETITTSYISTTGGLDTGATVYYVLATPTNTEITDTNLINQLNALSSQ